MSQDRAHTQQTYGAADHNHASFVGKSLTHQQTLDDGPRTPLSDSSQGSYCSQKLVRTPSSASLESQGPVEEDSELIAHEQQKKMPGKMQLGPELMPLSEIQKQMAPHENNSSATRACALDSIHQPVATSKIEDKLHTLINNGGTAELSNAPIANIRTKKRVPQPLKLESSKSLTSASAGGSTSPIKKFWGKFATPFMSGASHNANTDPIKFNPTSASVESAKAAKVLGVAGQRGGNEKTKITKSGTFFPPVPGPGSFSAPISGPTYEAVPRRDRPYTEGDVPIRNAAERETSFNSISASSVLNYYNGELPPTPPSKDVGSGNILKQSKSFSLPRTSASEEETYRAKNQEYVAKYPVDNKRTPKRNTARASTHVSEYNLVTPAVGHDANAAEVVHLSTKSLTRDTPFPSTRFQYDKMHGHRTSHSLSQLSMTPIPLKPSSVTNNNIEYRNTRQDSHTLAPNTFNRVASSRSLVDHEQELRNLREDYSEEVPFMLDMSSGPHNFLYTIDESNQTTPRARTSATKITGTTTTGEDKHSDDKSSEKTSSDDHNSPEGIIYMAGQVLGALLTPTNTRLDTMAARLDSTAAHTATLDHRVRDLDRHIKSVDKRVDHLGKQIGQSLQRVHDTTDGTFELAHERFESLEQRIVDWTARVGTVEKRLNAIEGRLGNFAAEQQRMVEMLVGLQRGVAGVGAGRTPDLNQHPYFRGVSR